MFDSLSSSMNMEHGRSLNQRLWYPSTAMACKWRRWRGKKLWMTTGFHHRVYTNCHLMNPTFCIRVWCTKLQRMWNLFYYSRKESEVLMMTHLATCKMNNEEHKLTVSVKFDMTPFQWNQEVWHILNLTTAARPTAQKLYKWTSKKALGINSSLTGGNKQEMRVVLKPLNLRQCEVIQCELMSWTTWQC